MPRKFFRRYLPDGEAVRASKYLAWCGTWLNHPNLWALNRDSVSGGVAIGLFAGLVPGPFQMLVAALLTLPLKKNLPVALATTLYTNPFTIAPLYLLAYGYGSLLMGASGHRRHIEPFVWNWSDWWGSSEEMFRWMVSLGPPLAVGLVALAVTLAALGYAAVRIAWRVYITLAWRARAHRRSRATDGKY